LPGSAGQFKQADTCLEKVRTNDSYFIR